jgi:hypothetical protein
MRQTHLLYHFVLNNANYSSVRKLSQFTRDVLRDIVHFFEYTSEKNFLSIDWALDSRSFNEVIRTLLKKITIYAEWLKDRRKVSEEDKSSSAERNISSIEISNTSRTSQFIRSIISKTFFRNKRFFKKLIKMSFKLSKNLSSKIQSTQIFLRKNKRKQSITQFKNIEASSAEIFKKLSESSVESSRNFAESSQNFKNSFENISLSEKTRDEVSKVILQKLKNRHSETFTNHKKSSHSIISFSFNEVEMTNQHSERIDQNMQEMIQAIIREMMSKIIQQSVTTTVNITAVNRSDSSAADHSQIISRITSKSREERWITSNIEFFDLMYDNKSTFIENFIEHVEKSIYFRNVHLFLKRVKNVVRVKNVNQVRENLFICLRDLTL